MEAEQAINEKVEILITDVQVDIPHKLAIVGVKVRWETADKRIFEWKKAYRLLLDQNHSLDSFNEHIRESIRKDMLLKDRVNEVLQRQGTPYNLYITL